MTVGIGKGNDDKTVSQRHSNNTANSYGGRSCPNKNQGKSADKLGD
jgi:hypothetical protein